MARCAHTGLLLLCLSQFSRRSKLPRVVESLRVPSPGTLFAMMLGPSLWHINGYTWDPNGPLGSQDQVWPDVMIVTAGVKHCFPADDHRGVGSANAWRSCLPKAIANRKIILTDTRQLSNPESDRGSTDRHWGDTSVSSTSSWRAVQECICSNRPLRRLKRRLNCILS